MREKEEKTSKEDVEKRINRGKKRQDKEVRKEEKETKGARRKEEKRKTREDMLYAEGHCFTILFFTLSSYQRA